MSHCYLSSKSKNNTGKWYFEYFIADYFPTLNKKDPVYLCNYAMDLAKKSVKLKIFHSTFDL